MVLCSDADGLLSAIGLTPGLPEQYANFLFENTKVSIEEQDIHAIYPHKISSVISELEECNFAHLRTFSHYSKPCVIKDNEGLLGLCKLMQRTEGFSLRNYVATFMLALLWSFDTWQVKSHKMNRFTLYILLVDTLCINDADKLIDLGVCLVDAISSGSKDFSSLSDVCHCCVILLERIAKDWPQEELAAVIQSLMKTTYLDIRPILLNPSESNRLLESLQVYHNVLSTAIKCAVDCQLSGLMERKLVKSYVDAFVEYLKVDQNELEPIVAKIFSNLVDLCQDCDLEDAIASIEDFLLPSNYLLVLNSTKTIYAPQTYLHAMAKFSDDTVLAALGNFLGQSIASHPDSLDDLSLLKDLPMASLVSCGIPEVQSFCLKALLEAFHANPSDKTTLQSLNALASKNSSPLAALTSVMDAYTMAYAKSSSGALGITMSGLGAACRGQRKKREYMLVSLMRLFVSTALRHVKPDNPNNNHHGHHHQSNGEGVEVVGFALGPLEGLLPALAEVTQGHNYLPKTPSAENVLVDCGEEEDGMPRSLIVSLFQEFWFAAVFHGLSTSSTPSNNVSSGWPLQWMPHIEAIARASPPLLAVIESPASTNFSEEDGEDGYRPPSSSSKKGTTVISRVLLERASSGSTIKASLQSIVAKKRPDATHATKNLSLGQCLWLMAVFQTESLKLRVWNASDSLFLYLTDDTVHALGLNTLVEDILAVVLEEHWRKQESQSFKSITVLLEKVVKCVGHAYQDVHQWSMTMLKKMLIQEPPTSGYNKHMWHVLLDKKKQLVAVAQAASRHSRLSDLRDYSWDIDCTQAALKEYDGLIVEEYFRQHVLKLYAITFARFLRDERSEDMTLFPETLETLADLQNESSWAYKMSSIKEGFFASFLKEIGVFITNHLAKYESRINNLLCKKIAFSPSLIDSSQTLMLDDAMAEVQEVFCVLEEVLRIIPAEDIWPAYKLLSNFLLSNNDYRISSFAGKAMLVKIILVSSQFISSSIVTTNLTELLVDEMRAQVYRTLKGFFEMPFKYGPMPSFYMEDLLSLLALIKLEQTAFSQSPTSKVDDRVELVLPDAFWAKNTASNRNLAAGVLVHRHSTTSLLTINTPVLNHARIDRRSIASGAASIRTASTSRTKFTLHTVAEEDEHIEEGQFDVLDAFRSLLAILINDEINRSLVWCTAGHIKRFAPDTVLKQLSSMYILLIFLFFC